MKHTIVAILFGKDTKFSGIIAFSVVAMIALGCTCGKNFDLANLGKTDNSSSTASNTPTDSNASRRLRPKRMLRRAMYQRRINFRKS